MTGPITRRVADIGVSIVQSFGMLPEATTALLSSFVHAAHRDDCELPALQALCIMVARQAAQELGAGAAIIVDRTEEGIDVLVAGDPEAQGELLGHRVFVAVVNDGPDTGAGWAAGAMDLLLAASDGDDGLVRVAAAAGASVTLARAMVRAVRGLGDDSTCLCGRVHP